MQQLTDRAIAHAPEVLVHHHEQHDTSDDTEDDQADRKDQDMTSGDGESDSGIGDSGLRHSSCTRSGGAGYASRTACCTIVDSPESTGRCGSCSAL